MKPDVLPGTGRAVLPLDGIELDTGGVHEIKPAFGGGGSAAGDLRRFTEREGEDWSAAVSGAFGFFARLIARRLAGFRADRSLEAGASFQSWTEAGGVGERAPLVWCFSRAIRGEYGLPYIHGLSMLGVRPSDLMVIETANTGETLWVLEEAMRSGAPVLVAGILDDVALTPARRLALAAAQSRVPCLVLSDARSPPAAATMSRWRVGPAPSGDNELEIMRRARNAVGPALRLPGPRRFSVALERYREAPAMAGENMHLVEWRDEAVCFDLVAAVSHRPIAARATRASAPG